MNNEATRSKRLRGRGNFEELATVIVALILLLWPSWSSVH